MASSVEHVTARDGTRRLVRRWLPAGESWANVLLLHGLGEHSGRYEAVGRRLADAGVAVEGFDHVGFGGSDGPRGDVDTWSHFHDDVEDRLSALRAAAGSLPVVLYGHSMGGLMALGYVLSDRPRPGLLVLTSPALADALPAWKHLMATVLGRVKPSLSVHNGLDTSILSRDPAVGIAYTTDPLAWHRSTVRLGLHAFREQARVRAHLAELDVPAYVVHGADDRLVPASASAPLGELPGVTRVVLPGLRHETHNEPEGPAVVDGIVGWLRTAVRAGSGQA